MPAWGGRGQRLAPAALPPSSRGRRSAQRRAAQGPPCAGSCDRTWLRAWQRPGRLCPRLVALDRLMPGGGRGAGCRPYGSAPLGTARLSRCGGGSRPACRCHSRTCAPSRLLACPWAAPWHGGSAALCTAIASLLPERARRRGPHRVQAALCTAIASMLPGAPCRQPGRGSPCVRRSQPPACQAADCAVPPMMPVFTAAALR